MSGEILSLMRRLDYSVVEAAEVFGISPGRLDHWLDDGHVFFTPRTLGPRRFLRRFDAHNLVSLGTMVELVDTCGLHVAEAKKLAGCLRADVSMLVMKIENGQGFQPLRPNAF